MTRRRRLWFWLKRRYYGVKNLVVAVWDWFHWEWVKRVFMPETLEVVWSNGARSGRKVARLGRSRWTGKYGFNAAFPVHRKTNVIAVFFRAPRLFAGEKACAMRLPSNPLEPGDEYHVCYQIGLAWQPDRVQA